DKGPYQHLFLLLEGITRAYQCDDNGRELTFYRNYPGDICPLNIQNLFNGSESDFLVRAETAVHGIQISTRVLQQCMGTSDILRNFIMQRMSHSFNQLTMKLQKSVFNKLDQRLCNLLSELFDHSNQTTLNITHQKLANELGTTREVISRSLKALENQGCLKITRGKSTMVSPEKLA
ncbi:MAG: Crp/Fnr family transcriptional regulator, partial [Gammaproteobacteria bacterium]|nr:Crp/Fnr family transcriptional regulator [Gammaproteobacteria bacterium]